MSYLETDLQNRTVDYRRNHLSDIDVLIAICAKLADERDRSPARVAAEATDAYEFVHSVPNLGIFDDRQFALGELAHLAGGANRFLGNRSATELWLCRAESAFRHTVNPTPALTQVAYTRLALFYDMGRHEEVLELLPEITRGFTELGMPRDAAKSKLFEAMTLKALRRTSEAEIQLESLLDDVAVKQDTALYARILVDLGDTQQLSGKPEQAIRSFERALPLLKATQQPMAVADLQLVVASTYRNSGRLPDAASAFGEAKASFAGLGMRANVAYVSVLRAETLLSLGRNSEADLEVLGALPTIEEQKMVPEGFAAVALLKESARRRKTDPNALRELREHLQANQ